MYWEYCTYLVLGVQGCTSPVWSLPWGEHNAVRGESLVSIGGETQRLQEGGHDNTSLGGLQQVIDQTLYAPDIIAYVLRLSYDEHVQ